MTLAFFLSSLRYHCNYFTPLYGIRTLVSCGNRSGFRLRFDAVHICWGSLLAQIKVVTRVCSPVEVDDSKKSWTGNLLCSWFFGESSSMISPRFWSMEVSSELDNLRLSMCVFPPPLIPIGRSILSATGSTKTSINGYQILSRTGKTGHRYMVMKNNKLPVDYWSMVCEWAAVNWIHCSHATMLMTMGRSWRCLRCCLHLNDYFVAWTVHDDCSD